MKRFVLAFILAAMCLQAQAANRFLLLTDSMFTQAYGSVRPSKMAPAIIAPKINGILNVMGSPGLTVAPQGGYAGAVDLLPAIESWKGRFGATGVFIHVSTNDHGLDVPLSAYKSSLSTLIAGIQGMGLGAVCIRPFAKITQNQINAAGYKLSDYQTAMAEVCNQHGVTMLTFSTVGSDFVDGIHLSEAGHAKFAEWLIDIGAFLGGWNRIASRYVSPVWVVAKR